MKTLSEHETLLKTLNDKLGLCESFIKDMQIRLDCLEQDKLANSIEIPGVTVTDNEDLLATIIKIGAKIEFKLLESHIVSVQRRGKQTHLGPPPLVVFFKDIIVRNGFFSSFRTNNGLTLTDIGLSIGQGSQARFRAHFWTTPVLDVNLL
ncbi:hypothetical protein Bhyg_12307 [Pseudolycoriella hygida]|uniref:Uncharacterized protein n=1 Tax=Pseudolycoriella hygida TaxID=35572 RepID=A0A9Q0MWZ4_9DIPT|nr:hypothetical protein Bhyg_12307 [Pseudolycoriella hygida]